MDHIIITACVTLRHCLPLVLFSSVTVTRVVLVTVRPGPLSLSLFLYVMSSSLSVLVRCLSSSLSVLVRCHCLSLSSSFVRTVLVSCPSWSLSLSSSVRCHSSSLPSVPSGSLLTSTHCPRHSIPVTATVLVGASLPSPACHFHCSVTVFVLIIHCLIIFTFAFFTVRCPHHISLSLSLHSLCLFPVVLVFNFPQSSSLSFGSYIVLVTPLLSSSFPFAYVLVRLLSLSVFFVLVTVRPCHVLLSSSLLVHVQILVNASLLVSVLVSLSPRLCPRLACHCPRPLLIDSLT